MGRGSGTYSRVVAGLRIVLPMAALALLSSLFLLARDTEQTVDFQFVESVGGRMLTEGARKPVHAALTEAGDEIVMIADTAIPGNPGAIALTTLDAEIRRTDGNRIDLAAPQGRVRDTAGTALLWGGVQILGTGGYDLRTDALRTALDRVDLESLGPVQGLAPTGTLEAGRMRIGPVDPDAQSGPLEYLFTDGVKVVYQPEPGEEDQ